eukprot:5866934-Pleurochrysis_carterae.AAC.2
MSNEGSSKRKSTDCVRFSRESEDWDGGSARAGVRAKGGARDETSCAYRKDASQLHPIEFPLA